MPEIMCGLVGYGSSDNEDRDGDIEAPKANGAAVRNIASDLNPANRPDARPRPHHLNTIFKHHGPMVSKLI